MQIKAKAVLQITDISENNKSKPELLTDTELLQDYNYFMAQKVAKTMLAERLISLSEFNKLTLLNRDTFSPLFREIMPKPLDKYHFQSDEYTVKTGR